SWVDSRAERVDASCVRRPRQRAAHAQRTPLALWLIFTLLRAPEHTSRTAQRSASGVVLVVHPSSRAESNAGTTRQTIQSRDAPAAIGPYSQAIRVGNIVYMSGQIGLDPRTGQLVEG